MQAGPARTRDTMEASVGYAKEREWLRHRTKSSNLAPAVSGSVELRTTPGLTSS